MISIRKNAKRALLAQMVLVLISLGWLAARTVQDQHWQAQLGSLGEINKSAVDLVLLASEHQLGDAPRATAQWAATMTRIRGNIEAVDAVWRERLTLQLTRIGIATERSDRVGGRDLHRNLHVVQATQMLARTAADTRRMIEREVRGQRHVTLIGVALLLAAALVQQVLSTRWIVGQFVARIAALLPEFERLGRGQFEAPTQATGIEELRGVGEAIEAMRRNLQSVTVSKDELAAEVQDRKGAEQHALQLVDDLTSAQARMMQMEKLSALGVFIGGVAHEIGNPLMAIENYLGYVIKHSNDARAIELLGKARGELGRIDRIVKDLLIFVRTSNHAQGGESQLHEVVVTLTERFRKRLAEGSVELAVELDAGLPALAISNDALLQVLTNLLTNALDASASQASPRIRIGAAQFVDQVLITVQDNGEGVPTDLAARIFDPFFTTKQPGKGTGLGLGISRQLVTEVGGELELDTDGAEGATFRITLPIAEHHAEEPLIYSGPAQLDG